MDNHKYSFAIDHGLVHTRAHRIHYLQQKRSKPAGINLYKDRRRLTIPGVFKGQFKQKTGLLK